MYLGVLSTTQHVVDTMCRSDDDADKRSELDADYSHMEDQYAAGRSGGIKMVAHTHHK